MVTRYIKSDLEFAGGRVHSWTCKILPSPHSGTYDCEDSDYTIGHGVELGLWLGKHCLKWVTADDSMLTPRITGAYMR